MHVLSKVKVIGFGIALASLAACGPAANAPTIDASYDELSTQLGNVKVESIPFDELPGDTRAEKLLYQAGIVSQMQTAMLVMFDTQIKTMRFAGNDKMADELSENRDILMGVMDEQMGDFVKDAGGVYDEFLNAEEIERLIVLHSDPAMKKLILNQPKMSQKMVPIGERFGQRASVKYEQALKAKAAQNSD